MKLTELRDKVTGMREELRSLTHKRAADGLNESEEKRFVELLDSYDSEEKNLRAEQILAEQGTQTMRSVTAEEDANEAFLDAVLRCQRDRDTMALNVEFRDNPSAGTTPTPTAGAVGVTSNEVAAATFDLNRGLLEPLRKNSLTTKAGFRWETNVQGTPIWASFGTIEADLVDEVEELKDKKIDFSRISAKPHRLGVTIPVSYRALNQSAYDLRSIIMNEIRKAMDYKLNEWFFHAKDDDGKFTKVSKNPFETLYPTTKLTYTANVTWKDLVGLETEVLTKDVDGEGCYLMNPAEYQALKYTPIVGDIYPAFMAGGQGLGNRLPNGARVEVSNHIPQGVIYYGVFDNAVVSQFGSVNFVIDGYTLATKGQIRFTANTEFDITTLRPEAFAVLKKK